MNRKVIIIGTVVVVVLVIAIAVPIAVLTGKKSTRDESSLTQRAAQVLEGTPLVDG